MYKPLSSSNMFHQLSVLMNNVFFRIGKPWSLRVPVFKSFKVFLSWLVTCFLFYSCAHKFEHADTVIHNAVVYTLDDNLTVTEAIAIKDGIIIETGPERHIMNKYSADEYVDAKGRAVYPGFFDAHCHVFAYGQSFLEADLRNLSSWEATVKKVKDFSVGKTSDQWIVGRGWDQNEWPDKKFPVKKALDEAFPNTPVYLVRIDGHAAIANHRALELAGITSSTNVEGGTVVLENNEPTGVLIDNAMDLLHRVIPPVTEKEIRKALILANANTTAYGITTLCDAGNEIALFKTIEKLQTENKFTSRVYGMLVPSAADFKFARENGLYNHKDKMIIRSFKIVADGALGSRGACMKKPYHDDAHTHGKLLFSPRQLDSIVGLVYDLDYQVNTHCIGDSANALLLRIYGKYLEKPNDLRWRIEHAQILDTADRGFFSKYSIIPSVQPTHAVSDMPWAVNRVGQRINGGYNFKQLQEQIGIIALGTDFPVEEINPFKTFYAAIARLDYNGQKIEGLTQETLTREEALQGMTKWAAMAAFMENKTGTIEKGKYADLVMVDRDIMKIPEKEILKAMAVQTFINGKRVHSLE